MAPSQRLLAMHPPTDTETVLPSANDVTGVWHDVPATAPAGPFRRPPPCYEGLGWFAFEQRGTELAMLRRFAEPAQGIKPVERVDQYEYARGERRGDAIELAGELVRETTPTEEPGPTRRETQP